MKKVEEKDVKLNNKKTNAKANTKANAKANAKSKNNKKQKQVVATASADFVASKNTLFKFNTAEIDSIFPILNENDNVIVEENKVQSNKDYKVIEKETGKVNELNRYKLEYDLLIWQKFYEKCHELENSFFIQDDNLEKATRNNGELEDITIRELKWRRQNKTYSDKLIEEYNHKLYDEYCKSTVGSTHEVEEIIKKNRFEFIYIASGAFLLSVILFVINILTIKNGILNAISSAFLAIALIFVLLFFLKKKTYKIRKYQAKINPELSYKEWVNKNCNSEEYEIKISQIKKNYVDLLKVKEERIIESAKVLTEIKARMMNIIPIHKDFYTEQGINILLNIVQARRCDTVRKALKFAKMKEYNVDYLSSSELLVKSMNYIEDSKIYISEYNNLMHDQKKEFDKLIDRNNKIINYLEKIKFEYVSLDNEPFIN